MRENSFKVVLLVEDNPGDARLLREMFDEQCSYDTELTHVGSMSEAEKHLAKHAVDIILLDLGLPDAQGLEALRRAHTAEPRIPLVVLTGLDDESLAKNISSKAKSTRAGCCEPCATLSSARPWKRRYSWKRNAPKSPSTLSATRS
jgi:CheY-like chemotaxis protein